MDLILRLHRGVGPKAALGDHGPDAGERLSPRSIDPLDAGSRVRTAHKLAPEHAGQVHVRGIARSACHLVHRVDPRHRLADHPILSHSIAPPNRPRGAETYSLYRRHSTAREGP